MRKLPVIIAIASLALAFDSSDALSSNEAAAVENLNIKPSWRYLANRGWPSEAMLAIQETEAEIARIRIDCERIQVAGPWLAQIKYSPPIYSFIPLLAPRSHPENSLWVLNQYVKTAKRTCVDSIRILESSHAKMLGLTFTDMKTANENSTKISIYAEASISKAKILVDTMNNTFLNKAKEIGAIPPEVMIGFPSLQEALQAKR